MAARITAFAVLGAMALVVLGLTLRGGEDRVLRASFDSAVQVVPGQEVRIAGRKVGKVDGVEEMAGDAVLRLAISDGDAWPLHRGTTARLRWGSTSGYALRYVELHPGPASAPALPSEGLLARAQTTTPVELDDVLRIFRGRGRADLGRVVDRLGDNFGDVARPLARSLRDAPAGLDQTADVLRAVGADEDALRTLVTAGARTASALQARRAQLRAVVGHAAQTFDRVALRAAAVRAALTRLPSTLRDSQTTLRRLDGSLAGLQGLVGDLRPGTAALRSLAPVTRETLVELRRVAPLAASTLHQGSTAAPPLTRLLRSGTPFLPRLSAALDRVEPMLGCLRPYGPEIASLLSTWTSFAKNYDAQGHHARAFLQAPPIPVGSPLDSEQAVRVHGGKLRYAMPRPPGLNAGQPWFQPQCDAGPQALDPSKDPERQGASR